MPMHTILHGLKRDNLWHAGRFCLRITEIEVVRKKLPLKICIAGSGSLGSYAWLGQGVR